MHTRVVAGTDPLATARAERLRALLTIRGFKQVGARVELGRRLQGLDGWVAARAATDPLRWEALAPDGPISLAHAAAVMTRAAVGDPASSPEDDAVAFLQASLADPTYASTGACVQVGSLDGEDVALVMAQVRPDTGWSRITWMGVVPEHRRRGYGGWAYARGLAMLRAQGGVHYRGGTDAANVPMRALFATLGAGELDTVEEWGRPAGRAT